MILISSNLESKIIDVKCDEDGRYILVKCELQGSKFFLVNAYAPNIEKDHAIFLQKLFNEIQIFYDNDYRYIVQEADWNFTQNIDLDRKGGSPKLWKKSIEIMDNPEK